jgi:hypothetical protein
MKSPHRVAELEVAGDLEERARCLLAARRSLLTSPKALAKAVAATGSKERALEELAAWARDLDQLAETCEEFAQALRTPTIGEFIELGKLKRVLAQLD